MPEVDDRPTITVDGMPAKGELRLTGGEAGPDIPKYVFHDAPAVIEVTPSPPRPGADGVRDAADELCDRL